LLEGEKFMSIKIFVNGKEEMLEDKINISELLKQKNIRKEIVTIELNNKIINKKDYDTIFLNEGDKVEMVYFMGGGNYI
jgi:thiamine biosynthesis protein ThiS